MESPGTMVREGPACRNQRKPGLQQRGPNKNRLERCSLAAQLGKNLPAQQETPVRFLGGEDSLEKGKATHFSILGLASLVPQLVKNLPAVRETWVRSLG